MKTEKTYYCRTCTHCGHIQWSHPPKSPNPPDKWRNAPCRECGNESLDFGQDGYVKSPAGRYVIPVIPGGWGTGTRKPKSE